MTTINVYMLDGRVYKYEVSDIAKAREHSYRITTEGFHNNDNGVMEYYPVHRIYKVTFNMPENDMLATKYQANGK